MNASFASRYIVDVDITDSYVSLGDSSKSRYYIDRSDKNVILQFKEWMKNVFLKGVSGTLTVFKHKKIEHDGQIYMMITHIITGTAKDVEEAKESVLHEV